MKPSQIKLLQWVLLVMHRIIVLQETSRTSPKVKTSYGEMAQMTSMRESRFADIISLISWYHLERFL